MTEEGRQQAGDPGSPRAVLLAALWEAFAAESEARERYAVFARRAEAQGYPQVARLFRASARGEELHAQRHLKAAKGVGGVEENLRLALELERQELDRYSPAREAAVLAGNRRAEQAFEFAEGVDREHQALFAEALAAVEEGGDLAPQEYLLCKVCGYLQLGSVPPDFCPVCGSPAEVFSPVE